MRVAVVSTEPEMHDARSVRSYHSTSSQAGTMSAQPLKSSAFDTSANALLTQMLNAGKIEPQEREQLSAKVLAIRECNRSKQEQRERVQRQQQQQKLVEEHNKLIQSTAILETEKNAATTALAAASAAERRDDEAARNRAHDELAWERKKGDSLIRFMRHTFESDEKAMAAMFSMQAEDQSRTKKQAEAAQLEVVDKLEKELRALSELGPARESYWSKLMLHFPEDLVIRPHEQKHWTPTLSEVTHAVDLEPLDEVDRAAWARRDITYRRAMHKPHRRRSLKSRLGARRPDNLDVMLQSVPQSVQLSPPSTAEGAAVLIREQASGRAADRRSQPPKVLTADSSTPTSVSTSNSASDSVSVPVSTLRASATISLAPTPQQPPFRAAKQCKDMAQKRAYKESHRWVDSLEVLATQARERQSSELRQRVAKAELLAEAAERECRQRAQKMQTEHAQSKRRWQTEASLSQVKRLSPTSQTRQWVCGGEGATAAQSAYAMKLMLQYPSEGLIEPDLCMASVYSNARAIPNTVHLPRVQQRKTEKTGKLAGRRGQQLDASASQRAQQCEQEEQADEDRETLRVANANKLVRRRSSARVVTAKSFKTNTMDETATQTIPEDAKVFRRVGGVQDDGEQVARRRQINASAEDKAEEHEQVPADRTLKVEHNDSKPPVQQRPNTADKQAQIALWREERLKHENTARRQEQEQQGRPLMSAGATLLTAGLAKKMRRKLVQVQRFHVSFETSTLGLRLAQYQAAPIAHRFRVDFVKTGGAAAALGVRTDDSLEKVGGKDLYALGVDTDLKKMVSLLATAPRPLVLTFLRSGSHSDIPASVPINDANENQQVGQKDRHEQVKQIAEEKMEQVRPSKLRARMAVAAKVITVAKSFQPAFKHRFVDVRVPPGPLGMQMAEVSEADIARAVEFKRAEEDMADEARTSGNGDADALTPPVSATPSRCRIFRLKPVSAMSDHPLSSCLDPEREPTFLVAVDDISVESLPVDTVVKMLLDKDEHERSLHFAVLELSTTSSALSSPDVVNRVMPRAPEEP